MGTKQKGGDASRYETRTIFPGIHLRPEGGDARYGLNFWPSANWWTSRGFILRLPNTKYYCRYSVPQGRLLHGWEGCKPLAGRAF